MSAGQEPAKKPAKRDSLNLETKAPPLPGSSPSPSMAHQDSLPPELAARLRHMDWFLTLLMLVLSFFVASFAVSNSDFWQHLATGRLIARGDYQFGTDPFLYTSQATETRPAERWVNHSWLYAWFLYWLHEFSGALGVVLAKGLLIVGLALLLCLMSYRVAAREGAGSLWISLVCTTLAMMALSPRLLLQPTFVSFLFLGIIWLLLTKNLSKAAGEDTRHLWLLPPLFALWANVDGFFILGLATVGLYWLGLLLQRWAGSPPALSPATLGLVMLISLAACLLNPHHFQVFALPGELSYLAVQLGDWLGLKLPAALGGPGRVLLQMQQHDPQYLLMPSPLNRSYLTSYSFGYNLAGLSYFLLLGLSLLSFVLTVLRGAGPVLWPRFLPWLFLAMLSLLSARLIPYFAIVAGVVAAVNLQWWVGRQGWAERATPGARGWMVAGRLLTGLGLALLLYLAWPGWLHSRWGEPAAPRRVAWRIDVDPSLQQLAMQLQRWQEQGQLGRGLALYPDVAHYCAWFAPAVKSSFDLRLPLFGHEVDYLFRSRQSLWDQARLFFAEGKRPPAKFNWAEYFRTQGIDHLIVTNLQDKRNQQLAQMLWLEASSWTELYADGRALVFGWHGAPKPDKFIPLRYDRDLLAFGPVPLLQRPPKQGVDYVEKEPLFWDRYAQGLPMPPLASQEAQQHLYRYRLMAQHWQIPWQVAWTHSSWFAVAGLGASAPGSVLGPATLAVVVQLPGKVFALSRSDGSPFLSASDVGPPADLILALRGIRRALADSGSDPRIYVLLAQTYQLVREQENHWLNNPNPSAQLLRPTLRRLQLLAALKQLLALAPHDSEVHLQLGQLFLSLNYRDLAVEHLGQAAKFLQPFPQEKPEGFRERLRGREEFVKQLGQDLKTRQNQFNIRAAGLAPLQKFQLALLQPFKFVDADNKEHVDHRGYGLALTGLTILQEIAQESLPEQEKSLAMAGLINLLINTGRFPDAIQELTREEAPKRLGPGRWHEFLALVSAALGNYQQADLSLAELEKMLGMDQRRQTYCQVAVHFVGWNLAGASNPQARLSGLPVLPDFLGQGQVFFEDGLRRLSDLRMLRGLQALENGDTHLAAQMFGSILQLTGPDRKFPDRPIATRYAALLKGRHK